MSNLSYTNINAMSDSALMVNIGAFVKHHRLQQNKTQLEVATAANISRSTYTLLERGDGVNLSTFIQVLRVLDLLYILNSFEIPNVLSPLLLAKLDKEKRERASSKRYKLSDEDPLFVNEPKSTW